MSIYTNNQIMERTNQMDRDDLIRVIRKILSMPVSPTMKSNFARIIMGEKEASARDMSIISKDKIVTKRSLMNVAESPMMNYLDELIAAALDPRGPFATRDIMLIAAEKKDSKAPFITNAGIPQTYKNHVGMILSMAGFERASHYDRTSKKPIKAWKSVYGWGNLSAEDRALEVRNIINRELAEIETKALPTLKDFI